MGSICCKPKETLTEESEPHEDSYAEFIYQPPALRRQTAILPPVSRCELCLQEKQLTNWIRMSNGLHGLEELTLVCYNCFYYTVEQLMFQHKPSSFSDAVDKYPISISLGKL